MITLAVAGSFIRSLSVPGGRSIQWRGEREAGGLCCVSEPDTGEAEKLMRVFLTRCPFPVRVSGDAIEGEPGKKKPALAPATLEI